MDISMNQLEVDFGQIKALFSCERCANPIYFLAIHERVSKTFRIFVVAR